jgi:hypothetical protein
MILVRNILRLVSLAQDTIRLGKIRIYYERGKIYKEDCILGITQAVMERSKETNQIQSVSYIEED